MDVKAEWDRIQKYVQQDMQLCGFTAIELVALRRILNERRMTLQQAMDELRVNDNEREWRDYFGILTELVDGR